MVLGSAVLSCVPKILLEGVERILFIDGFIFK